MVIIQASLNMVVKIDAMMKGLLETLMETGFDSDSVNHKNSIISVYKIDSYEESSVRQNKGNNATQIKCKEIGYLSALNNKISLMIKPTKKMPYNDIDEKDRDMNSKMTIFDIEYDRTYSV
ncbi:20419_t:CDS:1, partial [Racocetra persica]